MTQDERNRISTSRIMESAIKEFAHSGYDRGSVNAICTSGEILRGAVSHPTTRRHMRFLNVKLQESKPEGC